MNPKKRYGWQLWGGYPRRPHEWRQAPASRYKRSVFPLGGGIDRPENGNFSRFRLLFPPSEASGLRGLRRKIGGRLFLVKLKRDDRGPSWPAAADTPPTRVIDRPHRRLACPAQNAPGQASRRSMHPLPAWMRIKDAHAKTSVPAFGGLISGVESHDMNRCEPVRHDPMREKNSLGNWK